MRITPLDIQQKQFPVKFRGFDEEEVDSFLELVREEMEELLRDNASLREESKKYEKQVKEYKSMVLMRYSKVPRKKYLRYMRT
jgi:cell division initiation protein